MKILGIESSCDDTGVAILEIDPKTDKATVLSNVINSQKGHKKYGGVVPELAARYHTVNILPTINQALKEAKLTKNELDYIAVTVKPGLINSLLAGIETAKVLSYVWNIPIIGVNHIEGHIYACFINPQEQIHFPALILTVSGGHTDLVIMHDHGKYDIIGETKDDAAGEAFDKGAKMLGLGYPGGPEIAKMAKLWEKTGEKSEIVLPRPMLHSHDYNFSFSGLKTALLYQLQKDKKWKKRIPEYAFQYQQAIIEILIYKTLMAADEYGVKSIILSGGVSANLELRRQLETNIREKLDKIITFNVPDFGYTMDNAAMIAMTGYYKVKAGQIDDWTKLKASTKIEL